MRHPPPAEANCASGRWWRQLQIMLHALAAAVFAAWLVAAAGWFDADSAGPPSAAALAALAAAWLVGRRLPQPAGCLRWDGAGWWLETGGAAAIGGTATPVFDVGPWLLLRFAPLDAGPLRWLASADAGHGLRHLRTALHGVAPTQPARQGAADRRT